MSRTESLLEAFMAAMLAKKGVDDVSDRYAKFNPEAHGEPPIENALAAPTQNYKEKLDNLRRHLTNAGLKV